MDSSPPWVATISPTCPWAPLEVPFGCPGMPLRKTPRSQFKGGPPCHQTTGSIGCPCLGHHEALQSCPQGSPVRREPCGLLGSPQGRVWSTYICHYSTWAIEMLSQCTICPKGGCNSYATWPVNVTITSFAMCVPSRWACVTPVNYCVSAWERLVVGHGFLPSRFLSEPPLFLITMCRLVLVFSVLQTLV